MLITGIDDNLSLRAKIDMIAIAKYAAKKQEYGDPECYEKYMRVLKRISNLVEVMDSPNIDEALDEEEQGCVYHRLYEILQIHSDIPGMLSPYAFSTPTTDGVGYMSIFQGRLKQTHQISLLHQHKV